jgi:hypothetical protein
MDQRGFVLQTRIGLRSRNQFAIDGECDAQDVSPDHSFYQTASTTELSNEGRAGKGSKRNIQL